MDNAENPWIKKTKFLTQALVLSGALNICLLATFGYTVLSTRQATLLEPKETTAHAPSLKRTNEELLQAYSFLPFSELLLRLENVEAIEEGLCKRDIALACLVAFHHFPLEKSLGGWTPQRRQIAMHNMEGAEAISVNVFPGLSDFQFQAVIQFAKTEKWPLSSQGLFYEMKRQQSNYDPTLLETFYLTPEFHLISTLFFKTGLPLSKGEIIALLVSGDWTLLSNWAEQQKEMVDLSIEGRRQFLVSYFDKSSKIAAEILFKSDAEYCLKKFSDSEVLFLLSVLKERQIPCEAFVRELALSPRTDAVHECALALYPDLKIAPAIPLNQPEIEKIPPNVVKAEVEKKKVIHTVEPGESLWKIARKYKVTVDALVKENHLETEKLKPGKKLEIPQK